MPERARISAITHGDLAFHNPLSERRFEEVLDRVRVGPGARALDVGCGAGQLLIRLAERFGCSGSGYDSAEIQIAEARRRAAARGVDVHFRVSAEPPEGPFDLVACVGSIHALEGGVAQLAELTAPGGQVLLGDGFWRRPPEQAYLDALGGATAAELPDFAGLVRAGEPHGLVASFAAVTADEEWDRYEWTLIHNGLRFAAEHPADPLAEGAAAWARRARDRVLAPGGRDTLGFALLLLDRVYA